ncbi:MAG: hypothetical protein WCF85_11580 [Rhodospirillaceae bacterium]
MVILEELDKKTYTVKGVKKNESGKIIELCCECGGKTEYLSVYDVANKIVNHKHYFIVIGRDDEESLVDIRLVTEMDGLDEGNLSKLDTYI